MIELIDGSLYLVENEQRTHILNGDKVSFSFTLKDEDISKQTRTSSTPYVSHKKYFDKVNDVSFSSKKLNNGIEFALHLNSKEYSEWGINFPFNFMGKKNGGGYQNQYLFNSPYKDSSYTNNFIYLSNPNGHNLLLVLKTENAYWKMDYSPFCGGHFFINLKVLGQLDKLYTPENQNNGDLQCFLTEVHGFLEALDVVSDYLNKPVLSFDLSGGVIGTEVKISVHGEADFISDGEEKYPVKNGSLIYKIKREGIVNLVPYFEGKKGLECSLLGYQSIHDLYQKSIKSIDFDDIAKTDGNLCEHQCFVSATLRYLLRYGKNEEFENIALKALGYICETDETKARPRITILDKPQTEGYPAYHVYKSNRIQEQFFGVTILLDAYKYFKDEKYLRYASISLNTLIDVYQRDDGGFYTKMPWNDFYDDYSTVTCLIIPLVDMAIYFKEIDADLAKKYRKSATKLAEHVFKRGLNFPTETVVSDDHEPEMEDGSISCSALTLLYYFNHIEAKPEYLEKAKEILSLHEAWVVQTPLCNAYRSSLRWWETGWEGDCDGPALCLGHAWTIWRAEADFWMYKATGDETYLLKAKNSFNTNFAKINSKGDSFSIFNIDYISGGGFEGRKELVFRIAPSFPDQKDSGLSRYVWIRAAETIIDYLK